MSLNIDFTTMAPPAERGAFPEGWYTARIVASEPKETRAKDGGLLVMTFELLDPAVQGNKITERFNIWNANPVAVRIAMEDLKRISMATNVLRIQTPNAAEFMGIPMKIYLGIEKGNAKPDGSGDYPDKNKIEKYANINDPNAQAAPVQPQPAAGGFGPPAFGGAPAQAPAAGGCAAPSYGAPQAAPAAPQGGFAAPAYAAPAQPAQEPQAGAQQPWQQPGAAAAQPWQQPAQAAPQQAPAQAAPQGWTPPQAGAPAPGGMPPQAAPAGGAPPWAV